MRVYRFFVLLLCAALPGGAAVISPRLHLQNIRRHSGALYKTGSEPMVETILTRQAGLPLLLPAEARIRFAKSDLMFVDMPLSALDAVSRLAAVRYIEENAVSRLCLDKSAVTIQAPLARARFQVTGRNVIVGIVDSGIDWSHHDLRDGAGKTRIKYILDLSETGPYYGGRIFTEAEINAALQTGSTLAHHDYSGHGSHIAGIAAGDGSETAEPGTYAGIALEADIVAVKATRDRLGTNFRVRDQIIALTFIDSVAAVLQKPYVANLSFGGHSGAHDGTAVVERYIDQLVGPNKPGKAVVTVAGNDGEKDIHAFVQSSSAGGEMDVLIPGYSAQVGSDNDYVQIDGWYSGVKKVAITVISPGGATYGPVSAGQYTDKKGGEGSVYIWNGFYEEKEGYISGTNPFNGDREFYIEIGDAAGASPPRQGTWQILLKGDATDVHAWISSTTLNAGFSLGRNDNYKVSIPGTSKNGICVAAYTTKEVWDDMDGHHLTIDTRGTIQIGAIASFSSPGPARYSTPRKPDLAAPGQIIGSTFSRDALPDNGSSIFVSGSREYPNAFILGDRVHALSSGTSMAAPHVAGVIALILQKHPEASAGQIRSILAATAQLNSGDDVKRWGWGRVDAFAALQADPSQESSAELQWLQAYPNPFTDRTRIDFQLPIDREGSKSVRIRLVNTLGQHIKWLLDEVRTAGSYSLFWDGRDDLGYRLASGIYLIELEYAGKRQVQKVTLFSAP